MAESVEFSGECSRFMKVSEEKRIGGILREELNLFIFLNKIFVFFSGKETLNGSYFSITPYAVIIINQEGEKIFSLSDEDVKMEDALKDIPDLMEKIKKYNAKKY